MFDKLKLMGEIRQTSVELEKTFSNLDRTYKDKAQFRVLLTEGQCAVLKACAYMGIHDEEGLRKKIVATNELCMELIELGKKKERENTTLLSNSLKTPEGYRALEARVVAEIMKEGPDGIPEEEREEQAPFQMQVGGKAKTTTQKKTVKKPVKKPGKTKPKPSQREQ